MNHNRSISLERSVKLPGGGGVLNRFYGIPTSPSTSVMAQNISLWEMFSRARASNFKVNSPIWPEIILVRDFMAVPVT